MTNPHPFRFAVQTSRASSAKEWIETARRVEDTGYSALVLSDHYLGSGTTANGAQVLAAVPAIAAAAAVTTTLRVGTRVFGIDFHHPAVLAKEAATLDLLSDGRLELGLGAGWTADEYDMLGIPFDAASVRVKRLEEVISFFKAYFSGDELNVSGPSVSVHGFIGSPECRQRPWPRLMIGGGAQRVLTLAGREADVVSLNFDNRSGMGAAGVLTSTAERMDEKIGWVRDGAGARIDDIELEIGAYFVAVTDDGDGVAAQMGKNFGLGAADMRDHPNAFIGTVDEICESMQARRERWGLSYVTIPDPYTAQLTPVVERLTGK